jgi:hypothetical protein
MENIKKFVGRRFFSPLQEMRRKEAPRRSTIYTQTNRR